MTETHDHRDDSYDHKKSSVLPIDLSQSSEQDDVISKPKHYTYLPGVEPIDIAEWLPFSLGNVVKYVVRCGHKDDEIQELLKARWYLDREIQRRKKLRGENCVSPD